MYSIFSIILYRLLYRACYTLTSYFNHVGGIIIIGFVAFMLLSTKIPRLNFEKKIFPNRTKVSYPLSFVFGLAFATCWTPCIGPILGSILTLAATTPSHAFVLLLSYSFGLGIPFVLWAYS